MEYIINNNNEFAGFSYGNLTGVKTTKTPVKPLNNNEKALYNSETDSWEYVFNKFDYQIPYKKTSSQYFLNYTLTYIKDKGQETKTKSNKISILIPCYKQAKYVIEAVESSLKQTMQPDEVIVLLMDEESYQLKNELEKLSDKVKCIISQQLNASAARNELVKYCKNDFFVFLDADDVLSDNVLESMYKVESSIVGICCIPVDEKNEYQVGIRPPFNMYKYKPIDILGGNLTVLLHKEVWNEIGGLDEDLCKGGEDTDLLLRIFEQGKWKVEYCDNTNYHYRTVNNGLSHSEDFYTSIQKVIEKHKLFLLHEIQNSNKVNEYTEIIENTLKKGATQEVIYNTMTNDIINLSVYHRNCYYHTIRELDKSRRRKPLQVYNENDFIWIGEKRIHKSFYEHREFDCYFPERIELCNLFTPKSYLVNRRIYEKIKYLSDWDKLLVLITEYCCFFNDITVEQNNSIFLDRINTYDNLPGQIQSRIIKYNETIKNYRQTAAFVIGKKCDKNCSYCMQKNTIEKTLSEDELYANFEYSLTKVEQLAGKKLDPAIMGGEPSLWSPELTKKILNRLSKYRCITVYTNNIDIGKLEQFQNPRCFFEIHITDWEERKKIQKLNENERAVIVVTHQNIHLLDKFLIENADNEFIITPCRDCGNQKQYVLTEQDVKQFNKIIDKHRIICVTPGGGYKKTKEFCENCSKNKNTWTVDCNNLTVQPCCGTRDIYSIDEFNDQKPTVKTGCEFMTVDLLALPE